MTTRRINKIIIISFFACLIMYLFETKLNPNFLIKSIVKLIVFSSSIFLYHFLVKDKYKIIELEKVSRKSLFINFLIAFLVMLFIFLGYYLLKDFIDLDNIKNNLLSREKISRDNFIYVSLYISIVNSFLEEAFFRGFIFGGVLKLGYRKIAYIWSSLLFALYHISIVSSWFNPIIFVLAIFGLFLVGVFFNYISERSNTFIASWIVHAMANIAINIIGFIMLGIIQI